MVGKEAIAVAAHKSVSAPVLFAFSKTAVTPSGTVTITVATAGVNGAMESAADGIATANAIDPSQQPIL